VRTRQKPVAHASHRQQGVFSLHRSQIISLEIGERYRLRPRNSSGCYPNQSGMGFVSECPSPETLNRYLGLVGGKGFLLFVPHQVSKRRSKCIFTQLNDGQLNAHHTIAAAIASAATIMMNALNLFIGFSWYYPPNILGPVCGPCHRANHSVGFDATISITSNRVHVRLRAREASLKKQIYCRLQRSLKIWSILEDG
jgi:hypothetical protein